MTSKRKTKKSSNNKKRKNDNDEPKSKPKKYKQTVLKFSPSSTPSPSSNTPKSQIHPSPSSSTSSLKIISRGRKPLKQHGEKQNSPILLSDDDNDNNKTLSPRKLEFTSDENDIDMDIDVSQSSSHVHSSNTFSSKQISKTIPFSTSSTTSTNNNNHQVVAFNNNDNEINDINSINKLVRKWIVPNIKYMQQPIYKNFDTSDRYLNKCILLYIKKNVDKKIEEKPDEEEDNDDDNNDKKVSTIKQSGQSLKKLLLSTFTRCKSCHESCKSLLNGLGVKRMEEHYKEFNDQYEQLKKEVIEEENKDKDAMIMTKDEYAVYKKKNNIKCSRPKLSCNRSMKLPLQLSNEDKNKFKQIEGILKSVHNWTAFNQRWIRRDANMIDFFRSADKKKGTRGASQNMTDEEKEKYMNNASQREQVDQLVKTFIIQYMNDKEMAVDVERYMNCINPATKNYIYKRIKKVLSWETQNDRKKREDQQKKKKQK